MTYSSMPVQGRDQRTSSSARNARTSELMDFLYEAEVEVCSKHYKDVLLKTLSTHRPTSNSPEVASSSMWLTVWEARAESLICMSWNSLVSSSILKDSFAWHSTLGWWTAVYFQGLKCPGFPASLVGGCWWKIQHSSDSSASACESAFPLCGF